MSLDMSCLFNIIHIVELELMDLRGGEMRKGVSMNERLNSNILSARLYFVCACVGVKGRL